MEYILLQEVQQVLPFAERHLHRDLPPFVTSSAKEPSLSSGPMFDKVERNLKPFLSNGSIPVKILTLLASVPTTKGCFSCKRKTCFFIQVCKSRDSTFTTFCLNHMENARSVCHIPGHVGAVGHLYSGIKMKNNVEA